MEGNNIVDYGGVKKILYFFEAGGALKLLKS